LEAGLTGRTRTESGRQGDATAKGYLVLHCAVAAGGRPSGSRLEGTAGPALPSLQKGKLVGELFSLKTIADAEALGDILE
jgi:hypothetical protein